LAIIAHGHAKLALLCGEDHILAMHPADHIEGITRFAAKRQLQDILLNARIDGFADLVRDLKETVRRT
jgi:hypothetical protein